MSFEKILENNPKNIEINCNIFNGSLKNANLERKNPSLKPKMSISKRKKQLQRTFTINMSKLRMVSSGNSSFINRNTEFMRRMKVTVLLNRLIVF